MEHINWADGNKAFQEAESWELDKTRLQEIQEWFFSMRRTGSTTALIELMKSLPASILATSNMMIHKKIMDMAGLPSKNGKVKCITTRFLPDTLRGQKPLPILIDTSFVNDILEIAITDIAYYKNYYKDKYRKITEDQVMLSETINRLFRSWNDHKYMRGVVTSKGIADTAASIISAYSQTFIKQHTYQRRVDQSHINAIKLKRVSLDITHSSVNRIKPKKLK